jgi:hypothetical protein
MATAETMSGEEGAFASAVLLQGFQRVGATGGGEAATQPGGAKDEREHRRNQRPVASHEKDQNVLCRFHSVSFNNLAR